jgi:hypothetical protein
VTRLVALVLAFALLSSGAALAQRGEPNERFTPADQARARAMTFRVSDFPGFASRPGAAGGSSYCEALDESDLTISGKAISRQYTAGVAFMYSTAYVYRTLADSNASWRRGTSAAGMSCLRVGLRQSFAGTPLRMRSFGRLAFPRLGDDSVAFRLVAERQGVRVFVDLVAIREGRAQAALFMGSALVQPTRETERELARTIAARMAKAMRGA